MKAAQQSAMRPAQLRQLFPAIEPHKTGALKVSDLHTIAWEESGNPKGQPVVILHGGPGGGMNPSYRQYFDPSAYRILGFDQRGAGNSTPSAELEDNNTWALVEDIEKLRVMWGVEKWVVFGGSWGSTLSLAYAQTHPDRVKALVLRGIFTLRRSELQFFYQEGTNWIFPDAYDRYVSVIPEAERGDLIGAFYRRLTGKDEAEKLACAAAWSCYELATSRLFVDPEYIRRAAEDAKFALAFARIESHYFVHGGFFKYDGQLIQEASKLKNIPGVIVQGRYDMVCPMKSAWDLHKVWPEAEFHVAADAGHSCKEDTIVHYLVEATEKFKNI